MFTIIGGDGKEYGPVTTDQVRAWIAGGRANLDTQAKIVGTTEWKRLADFPEFTGGADVTPPPLGATGAVGTATVTPVVDHTAADRGTRLGAAIIDRVISMIVAAPGAMILGGT